MVMPLACLVVLALMGIIFAFHGDLAKQVESHKKQVSGWDFSVEMELIRNHERFVDWIQE